jgi:sensor histidine kinase YesM
MNLLKMRFEDSLEYELKVVNPSEAKVVPLSLQLLLENAVKHNVISAQRPLQIEFTSRMVLVIQNDYQKKEVYKTGKGRTAKYNQSLCDNQTKSDDRTK